MNPNDLLKAGMTMLLGVIVLVAVITWSIATSQVEDLKLSLRASMEQAYFEGQYAAIHGDIRIAIKPDSTYRATKSFWDNCMPNTKPNFKPNKYE